jgi:hypothetical protein
LRRPVWREGEVWLDPSEIQWFGEVARSVRAAVSPQPLLAGAAGGAVALPGLGLDPLPSARAAVRRRRPGPSRRRRLATRLLPTVAVALAVPAAGATFLTARGAERVLASPSISPRQAAEDLTPFVGLRASGAQEAIPAAEPPAGAAPAPEPESAASASIAWRDSRAVGVPHAGRLVDGVALPVAGPGWVTWDPVLDRRPNRAGRLYGTDALVRLVLAVVDGYHAANPDAPRVVIGDLSRRLGGAIDEHVSHENGLDVDVYYPRRDGKLRPPATVSQIDLRLAQDLLDRFVAAGAQVVFVGTSTSLRGPGGVVVPYPNHNNHMHVRIPAPA